MEKTYNVQAILDSNPYPDDDFVTDIFEYMLTLEKEYEFDDDVIAVRTVSTFTKLGHSGEFFEKTNINIDESLNNMTPVKMHFNGECDSSQTKYESLSNRGRVCTISRVDTVGKALHTFLRIIIDDHPGTYWSYVLDDLLLNNTPQENESEGAENKSKTSFTLNEIVEYLAKTNSDYHQDYLLSEKYIKTTLRGYRKKTRINRNVENVDKWDIYRIGTAIGIWSAGRRYEDM